MVKETRKQFAFRRQKFMVDINHAVGEASLRAIEAKTGVSASTLSRFQNGKEISMDTFLTLCSKLELDPANYFVCEVWERVDTDEE